MAPQPDNDNTPKAPDKNDKTKGEKQGNSDTTKEKNKDFKTVNNLNDCELKDLLDEAITYKNPKDREGKSTLFKELLSQAEESERNARAASAGGSEQVRYCNTSAKRSKHRRKPNSISENVMHGGSLDNLAKEDLFEVVHHLSKPKRTVSARQREGGSLPSNVNAGSLASYDPHFLEEARRKRTVRGGGPPETMDDDMERAKLLDHDSVAENHEKEAPTEGGGGGGDSKALSNPGAPKFTTKATLQVNVDDALHFKDLDHIEKKPDIEQISAKVLQTKYSVFIQDYGSMTEATKKVDENGNALHQNTSSKAKKKKVQAEKNVMSSYSAEKLVGHRGDIINDVDKLVEFIGDGGAQNRNNSRQKQLHKNAADVGGKGGKKQRGAGATQSAKINKEATRNELKKSNSLEEVSTTKLDEFKFEEDKKEEKAAPRAKEEGDNKASAKLKVEPVPVKLKQTVVAVEKVKPVALVEKVKPVVAVEKAKPVATVEKAKSEAAVVDKTKERKLSDNVEPFAFSRTTQEVTESSSSEFRVVTKKKKTKKRRNSLSGTRHKPSSSSATAVGVSSKLDAAAADHHRQQRRRTSSPVVPRRKSVCSVPQSEKSNDSSDVDSVHSLPAAAASSQQHRSSSEDAQPISYADIARNAEKRAQQQQEQKKQYADAKVGRDSLSDQGSPKAANACAQPSVEPAATSSPVVVTVNAQTQTTPPKAQLPPDVHSVKNFPAISRASGGVAVTPSKVDKAMNTPRPQVRLAPQQQQQQFPDRQRGNAQVGNNRNVKPQTVVASSQTATYVPEQQQQPHQQRDLKTDLSIIQANDLETVQYNNQIMPNMEIPDVQTIEKLNYMNQPGAHMPPHLQHHVVPPQHLHMAIPPQQRQPVNQPPHHIPMMIQQPQLQQQTAHPEIYHPQQGYNPGPPSVVAHHHHHHHHHAPHHALAFPPQAYEGVAVAYVDPVYMPTQQAPPPQQPMQINPHLHQQQQQHHQQQQQQPQPIDKTSKWAEQESRSKPKQQKRFDRSQGHVDRRKDNARISSSAPPTAPPHHLHSPHQTVTLYRRDPALKQRVEPAPPPTSAASTRADASNCDSGNNEANVSDCASSGGEEGQGAGDRPPVVILSGAAKDVPGIEFGFAVNPDLVCADATAEPARTACEIFDRYYRPPADTNVDSYNHDKVVHYLGTAWEDVLNSDKAVFYASSSAN